MRNTIILALLISLASGAVIDDIVVTPEDINTKIIIKADAPFVANSFTLKDPSRIIIDCSGVSSTLADKSYAVNRGGIKELS
ncbi:AMIN domain-containing protein, partial [candidate division WOR-3 bacterium]|nr:AMIN domain-containing protein [candidate division WOR-3 bacterium]